MQAVMSIVQGAKINFIRQRCCFNAQIPISDFLQCLYKSMLCIIIVLPPASTNRSAIFLDDRTIFKPTK